MLDVFVSVDKFAELTPPRIIRRHYRPVSQACIITGWGDLAGPCRQTWLRTAAGDLRSFNLGLSRAQNRTAWSELVQSATSMMMMMMTIIMI